MRPSRLCLTIVLGLVASPPLTGRAQPADTVPDPAISQRLGEDWLGARLRDAETRALTGDADTRIRLAEMLWHAEGTDQDVARASTILAETWRAGSARAAWRLGEAIYRRAQLALSVENRDAPPPPPPALGVGIEDDAVVWFRRAAEAGLPEAQASLASKLRYVEHDPEWATWARKAAKAGNARAIRQLRDPGRVGETEWTPEVVPLQGPDATDPKAIVQTWMAGQLLPERGARDLPPDPRSIPPDVAEAVFGVDVEEADNQAFVSGRSSNRLLSKRYVLLMIASVTQTAGLTAASDGREEMAATLLEVTARAKKGDTQSACNLGLLATLLRMDAFIGPFVNIQPPAYFYGPLARLGAARAQYHMGAIYRDGLGVVGDKAVAARWFWLAATQGFGPAQAALGIMLATGDGISKDVPAAIPWLRPAAADHDEAALFELGRVYFDGDGVPADRERGIASVDLAVRHTDSPIPGKWLRENAPEVAANLHKRAFLHNRVLHTGVGNCRVGPGDHPGGTAGGP